MVLQVATALLVPQEPMVLLVLLADWVLLDWQAQTVSAA